jgi:hypothetical protein
LRRLELLLLLLELLLLLLLLLLGREGGESNSSVRSIIPSSSFGANFCKQARML